MVNARLQAGLRLTRVLLACTAACCAALWPRLADVQDELLAPVRCARVELDKRAPALISLPVAAEQCTMLPESLGYFNDSGAFIYSADVARGVIYGSQEGTAFVVEVTAPLAGEAYFEEHLDRLRRCVQQVNTERNKLALAARPAVADNRAVARLLGRLWQEPPRGAACVSDAWLADALRLGRQQQADLTEKITAGATQQVKLKQQYYAVLQAKLELKQQQYDLEIALAQLPKRSGPPLLPRASAAQIAEAGNTELAQLAHDWRDRLAELERQSQTAAERIQALNLPPAELPKLPTSGAVSPTPAAFSQSAQDAAWARTALEQAALEARLQVIHAEQDELDEALAQGQRIADHLVEVSGANWDNLPRHNLTAQELVRPETSLAVLEDLERIATDQRLCAAALLKLARLYEGGRGRPGPPDVEAQLQDLRPDGQELACGILLIDQYAKRVQLETPDAPMAAGPAPGVIVRDAPLRQLVARLDAVLERPDDYGAAALDLGYLQFMRWYALQAAERMARSVQTAKPPTAAAKR